MAEQISTSAECAQGSASMGSNDSHQHDVRLRRQCWLLAAALLSFLFAQAAEQPQLTLKDMQGVNHSIADYRGKIVVLNFWATWCVPCKDEMPIFGEVDKRYRAQGVVVLAASLDDEKTRKYINQFARSYKMNFPILVDATSDDMKRIGLGEMVPSTLFLDRDGTVAGKILGQAPKKDVFRRVEWLLSDRQGEPPEPVTYTTKKR
jgi:thiol-disulfide isomerase/thioredoxin